MALALLWLKSKQERDGMRDTGGKVEERLRVFESICRAKERESPEGFLVDRIRSSAA